MPEEEQPLKGDVQNVKFIEQRFGDQWNVDDAIAFINARPGGVEARGAPGALARFNIILADSLAGQGALIGVDRALDRGWFFGDGFNLYGKKDLVSRAAGMAGVTFVALDKLPPESL